jgi:kinesin family member 1
LFFFNEHKSLSYADRAKQIKTKAVVNESETEKLIRSLKEENERLKKMLEGGNVVVERQGLTEAELQALRKQMEDEVRAQLENNNEMMNRDKDWEASHQQAIKDMSEEDKVAQERDRKKQTLPYFINLNEDPMLSGVVFLFLEKPYIVIGKGKQGDKTDIVLSGLSISNEHAIVTVASDGSVSIKPGNTIAKTKVSIG